jgi:adenylylsulfate kinase
MWDSLVTAPHQTTTKPAPAAPPESASDTEAKAAGSTAEQGQHRGPGATIWFTGLPSSGKSTIAYALARQLRTEGRRVQVLDGDEVRPRLSAELGFSRKDRDVNVRRIGWVARLLASHGVVVLVPVIAPFAEARKHVRDDHAAAGVPYAEVYVSTSLEVAESRDVKGLYAKARRGEISALTGVDDPYEQPRTAELVIDTAALDLEMAVEMSEALLAAILEGDAT